MTIFDSIFLTILCLIHGSVCLIASRYSRRKIGTIVFAMCASAVYSFCPITILRIWF